jgi:hypothetical protein
MMTSGLGIGSGLGSVIFLECDDDFEGLSLSS